MNSVQLRLIGTVEDCATVIALLSQLAPVEIKTSMPAHTSGTRIYAEIRTRLRNP